MAIGGAFFGQSNDPVGSQNFLCNGSEISLSSCPHTMPSMCSHHQDAGVICFDTCAQEGSIRLFGSNSDNTGYVQICRDGIWGFICDYNWCENEAKVVCRELGYSSNRKPTCITMTDLIHTVQELILQCTIINYEGRIQLGK